MIIDVDILSTKPKDVEQARGWLLFWTNRTTEIRNGAVPIRRDKWRSQRKHPAPPFRHTQRASSEQAHAQALQNMQNWYKRANVHT
jgi:hypothetical protein